MRNRELKTALFNLSTDLQNCARQEMSELDDWRVFKRMPDEEVHTACYDVLRRANHLYDAPATDARPSFAFTKKVLEAAGVEGRVEVYVEESMENTTCFQAEMRFLRAIARRVRNEPGRPGSPPDAILFDETGRPYAFQKSDGEDTAITWRSAWTATEAGRCWVPAGVLLQVNYSGNNDPRWSYQGAPLVALEGRSCRPSSLGLLRFTTQHLPQVVRSASHAFSVIEKPELRPFAAQTSGLTDAMVAAACYSMRQYARVV